MPRRARPRDYLAPEGQPRFGYSRNVAWLVPEGGTQSGCAAAQLQHHVARYLRDVAANAHGVTSVDAFCRARGLAPGRMRLILSGERAMSFEDIGGLIGRLNDRDFHGEGPSHEALTLLGAFAEPITYSDVETEVVKRWPANAATRDTWIAARPYLDETVRRLILRVLPWVPKLTITADPEPAHAEQPASGYVNSEAAKLRLYLDESWKTEVLDEGYARASDYPVIGVHGLNGTTLLVLDLEHTGLDEYEFVIRHVQR